MFTIITTFKTIYTKETELRIEDTSNFNEALDKFTNYIRNPECVDCNIVQFTDKTYKKVKKIYATFKI